MSSLLGASFMSLFSCMNSSTKYEMVIDRSRNDLPTTKAKNWIDTYPIPTPEDIATLYKIDKLAKKCISSLLKKVTLDASNYPLIESHILKLASVDELYRRSLVQYLNKRNKPNPYLLKITERLIFLN